MVPPKDYEARELWEHIYTPCVCVFYVCKYVVCAYVLCMLCVWELVCLREIFIKRITHHRTRKKNNRLTGQERERETETERETQLLTDEELNNQGQYYWACQASMVSSRSWNYVQNGNSTLLGRRECSLRGYPKNFRKYLLSNVSHNHVEHFAVGN